MESIIHRLSQHGIAINLRGDRLELDIPRSFEAKEILEEVRSNKTAIVDYIRKIKYNSNAGDNKPQPVASQDTYEIFHAQEKEYMRFQIMGNFAFNHNFVVIFEDVDTKALEMTIRSIIERHESLRTTLLVVDGEMRQRVHLPSSDVLKIKHIDLAGVTNKDEILRNMYKEVTGYRFNFENEPLADIRVVKYTVDLHILSVTLHHAISDSTSTEILNKEIRLLYDQYKTGNTSPFPPLKLQYKDYAKWVNDQLKGERGSSARAFYKKRILASVANEFGDVALTRKTDKGYRERLAEDLRRAVGVDGPKRFQRAFGSLVNLYPDPGAQYIYHLDKERLEVLKHLATESGSNLYTVLVAVFCFVVNYSMKRKSVRVYMPFSTRTNQHLEEIVGWLTSEIIVAIDIEETMTVSDLVKVVQNEILETSEHRLYPHEYIMNDMDMPLELIAPVFINFIKASGDEPYDVIHRQHSEDASGHFPLRCELTEYINGLDMNISYNCKAYRAGQIEAMMDLFETLTNPIPGYSEMSLAALKQLCR